MTSALDNRINFRVQAHADLRGSFDPSTGEVRFLGTPTEDFALDAGGDLTKAQRDALLSQLGLASSNDVEAMTDRVAERVDSDAARPQPPEAYANGVYTEASSAAQLREGFKGADVKAFQEEMAEAGYDLGRHGADGFWGPETQAAYEAYTRDGNPAPSDAPSAVEEAEAAAEEVAAPAGPDEARDGFDAEAIARDLARTTHRPSGPVLDPQFDPAKTTETLLGLNNEEMCQVKDALDASGVGLEARIDKMSEGWMGRYLIPGRDAHYQDLLKRVADGQRNEGAAAEPTDAIVDRYQATLQDAAASKDYRAFNAVFAEASDAQLRALDARLREGSWGDDGQIETYDDGLEALVRDVVVSTGISDNAHRDALMMRLSAARG